MRTRGCWAAGGELISRQQLFESSGQLVLLTLRPWLPRAAAEELKAPQRAQGVTQTGPCDASDCQDCKKGPVCQERNCIRKV